MHGYNSYAEYATADTMAGTPDRVMQLLEVRESCVAVFVFVTLVKYVYLSSLMFLQCYVCCVCNC